MKKLFGGISVLFATTLMIPAAVLVHDNFDYPDGNIVSTSGGNWKRHSGSGNDSLVSSGGYQVRQDRSDDVNREFSEPNAGPFLFASFVVNLSVLPTINGTYFAHFKDETTSNFVARVFALRRGAEAPGTFRLGIANISANATNVFPQDLATNVDYHVVVSYDLANYVSSLYIDPAAPSDPSVAANDIVGGAPAIAYWSAYAFRQAANVGSLRIDSLIVGNDFSEVVTNSPKAPAFGVEPVGTTNYAGSPLQLFAVAHGTGQLQYQWRQNGVNLFDGGAVSGANSPSLVISSLSGAHSGDYDVVVTSPYGSVTSKTATVSVDTATNPPLITRQPMGATNSVGSSVTLSVQASGPGPITYQWLFDGVSIPGATTNRIVFDVVTNENTGPYRVRVSNPYGTTQSDIAFVQVLPPLRTNIAFLRTLQNPETWLPTNYTTVYEIEGVITTHTNITTSGNALYYMQDDTAGIALFYSGSSTFRPAAGDRVRVVAPLATFNSLLEVQPVAANALHSAEVLSSGDALPQPRPFAFSETNDIVRMETAVEGSLVKLTNVYFPGANGSATFPLGANVVVTNAQGEPFTVRIDSRVTSFGGVVMPSFAYEVIGAMGQFQGPSSLPRNGGYQLIVTRPEDIITTEPVRPLTLSIQVFGEDVRLTWPASAGASYTVWAADKLSEPFKVVRSGLTFSTGEAVFSEVVSATGRFYRVSRQ